MGISVLATLLGTFLLAHRVIYGPQQEGALWILSAVTFFFFGLAFLAFGLLGEYIERIYLEVRRRPTYIVRALHGQDADDAKFEPPHH
jgi:undecaprenyl-phosphate 4-deoxy-4-formamido-L-arabinose transferase